MECDFKIRQEDIWLAKKFIKALDDCYSQNQYNCFSDFAAQRSDCLKCPLSKFKAEIYLQAKPFWDGHHRLAVFYIKDPHEKYLALRHFLFGLAAMYSANQEIIPAVSGELIQEISQWVQNDSLSAIREIISDLNNLNFEWYKGFYSMCYYELRLPTQLWVDNILLLKVFLEAIWRSGNKNEELFNEISRFLEQERKKK